MADPHPLETILGAGHPIFISIMSGLNLSSISLEASDIISGSLPKSWIAHGRSLFEIVISSKVFLL